MALNFSYKYAADFIRENDLRGLETQVKAAHDMLNNKSGLGNDFTGWVDLPFDYDKEEFARIKKAAEKIKADTDVFVVQPHAEGQIEKYFLRVMCKVSHLAFHGFPQTRGQLVIISAIKALIVMSEVATFPNFV